MQILDLSHSRCEKLAEVIQQIYIDGDPIRSMIMLANLSEIGIKHGLLTEEDRFNLVSIHAFLGEIALLREHPPEAVL